MALGDSADLSGIMGASRDKPVVRAKRPAFDKWRRRVFGPLFARLGYDLVPAVPEWDHRPLSQREVNRLLDGATQALAADLAASGLPTASLDADVRAFWTLIGSAPVRQKQGGNGFNGSLQLFVIARAIRPELIVESGVFRGFTTWILRQACPSTRILSFDPVHDQIRYRDANGELHAHDWSAHDFADRGLADALLFFDDHIDQARRVLEAAERGARHLVFDDNSSAHRIHTHGGPAWPTIDMVLDRSIEGGEPVRWLRHGLEFTYRPDAAFLDRVRSTIARAHAFDDLHRETGYSPARLTYVQLKDA